MGQLVEGQLTADKIAAIQAYCTGCVHYREDIANGGIEPDCELVPGFIVRAMLGVFAPEGINSSQSDRVSQPEGCEDRLEE